MSTSTRRRSPLAAAPQEPPAEVAPSTIDAPPPGPPPPPPSGAGSSVERDERFAEGVRTLRIGGSTFRLEERILMVAGGVIAPLGLIIVLLGWWGAAHTPYVFEQVPYLISGGLLGVALVFLGALCYFTHWITQLVKEQRAQSAAVLDALHALTEEVASTRRRPTPATAAASNGARPEAAPAVLVATERGTMAHRPDCVVLAGKGEVRTVTTADGLAGCKLCEPYAPAAPGH